MGWTGSSTLCAPGAKARDAKAQDNKQNLAPESIAGSLEPVSMSSLNTVVAYSSTSLNNSSKGLAPAPAIAYCAMQATEPWPPHMLTPLRQLPRPATAGQLVKAASLSVYCHAFCCTSVKLFEASCVLKLLISDLVEHRTLQPAPTRDQVWSCADKRVPTLLLVRVYRAGCPCRVHCADFRQFSRMVWSGKHSTKTYKIYTPVRKS